MIAFLLLWLASDSLLIPAGRPAPVLEAQTLQGDSWGAELTGQITIVEFFASWCPHCRRSLAAYPKLIAERRVQLIIVDVEEEPALVQQFFTRFPPPGRAGVLLDPDGRIRRRWGVSGLPAVFLIDKTGTVRDSFAGWGDDSIGDLAKQIDAINNPPVREETKRKTGSRRKSPKKPPAARPPTHDDRARQLGVEVIR